MQGVHLSLHIMILTNESTLRKLNSNERALISPTQWNFPKHSKCEGSPPENPSFKFLATPLEYNSNSVLHTVMTQNQVPTSYFLFDNGHGNNGHGTWLQLDLGSSIYIDQCIYMSCSVTVHLMSRYVSHMRASELKCPIRLHVLIACLQKTKYATTEHSLTVKYVTECNQLYLAFTHGSTAWGQPLLRGYIDISLFLSYLFLEVYGYQATNFILNN